LDGERYDEYATKFNKSLERAEILEAAHSGRPPEVIEEDGKTYKIGFVALSAEKDWGRGAVAVISDITESTKVENMQIDFVSNVSHELKTPLSSVSSYAETLLSGVVDDPEKEKEFLNIIVTEAKRMAKLISYTRAEYMGENMDTAESELTSLVKMTMKKLDMTANKKALSLIRLFSDDLSLTVEMNRDKVEQVIQNILSNAIKYTEERGRIDVDIIPGQNCVQIVISDNGSGISEEDLSRVFEPFYMGDKARSGEKGGSGLGLTISKKIVDAHGGTIGIESNLGRGTTVTVSLPAGKYRGSPGIL